MSIRNDLIKQAQENGYVDLRKVMPYEEDSENLINRYIDYIKPYISYQIAGMREEKYMGKVYHSRNINSEEREEEFEEREEELTRYIVCCTKGGKKYEISLKTEYGISPSDHSTASWGILNIQEVSEFGEITHIPKEKAEAEFNFIINEYGDFYCPAFYYSEFHGDAYYPNGSAYAHEDFFIEKDITRETEQEEVDLMGKTVEELKETYDSTVTRIKAKKEAIDKAKAEKKRKEELIEAIHKAQAEEKRLDEELSELSKHEI